MTLDLLLLEPMASGNTAILLSRSVSWDHFPVFAEALASLLKARVVSRADNPAQRVWTVEFDGLSFWISWDDFAGEPVVSLEPRCAASGAAVHSLHALLIEKKESFSPIS